VQLTTLLDTVYQGVSTTGADDFDRLVADLIPCRTHDPELWFAEHTAQVEQAKALCRTCPVREGCLAGALEREEPWGVWGGEVFVGGAVVATKRGRGRPRKSTVSPAA
jgi:WhiB family redox-sensing transcriptional regulator